MKAITGGGGGGDMEFSHFLLNAKHFQFSAWTSFFVTSFLVNSTC
jgi:hypothetical protein